MDASSPPSTGVKGGGSVTRRLAHCGLGARCNMQSVVNLCEELVMENQPSTAEGLEGCSPVYLVMEKSFMKNWVPPPTEVPSAYDAIRMRWFKDEESLKSQMCSLHMRVESAKFLRQELSEHGTAAEAKVRRLLGIADEEEGFCTWSPGKETSASPGNTNAGEYQLKNKKRYQLMNKEDNPSVVVVLPEGIPPPKMLSIFALQTKLFRNAIILAREHLFDEGRAVLRANNFSIM